MFASRKRTESDILLRLENMSSVSAKSKTYNYDHAQKIALSHMRYLSVPCDKHTEQWLLHTLTDCCTRWLTATHTDWLLHTLTYCFAESRMTHPTFSDTSDNALLDLLSWWIRRIPFYRIVTVVLVSTDSLSARTVICVHCLRWAKWLFYDLYLSPKYRRLYFAEFFVT